MKILILLLSSHQEKFVKQTRQLKKVFNEHIKMYGLEDEMSVFDYIGSYENNINTETHIKNSTIYCKSSDDYNHLYIKTIEALTYIDENIEYDYIFRTNNSTFINIRLLYEYLNRKHDEFGKGIQLNGAPLLRSKDAYIPNVGDIMVQGKGMIINNDTVKYLINNVFSYDPSAHKGKLEGYVNDRQNDIIIHGIDDIIISMVVNKYHININNNYTNYIHTYCHLSDYNISLDESKTFDAVKFFISITLKNNANPDDSIDNKITLLNMLFKNNYDDNIEETINFNIEYDKHPTLFNGLRLTNFFEPLDRSKYENYNNRHRIALICTHKDHMKIAPFVIDYWKRFVSHAYVFDNGSTDGSLENFAKYDWISVIDFSNATGGKLDDKINIEIKNKVWKDIRLMFDYVVICDFDECLYCKNFNDVFTKLDNLNAALIYPKYCNMISDEFVNYDENKLYHELNPFCQNTLNKGIVHIRRINRCYIINPKLVEEINYLPGQEVCYPIADNMTPYYVNNLYMFHLHYIGVEYADNIRDKNLDMSDSNKNEHLGFHLYNENNKENIKNMLNNKIHYNELLYPCYKNY